MEVTEAVLATMKENGAPMSAGQIATATGIDRKEIDKAMKKLKADGSIVSPVRPLQVGARREVEKQCVQAQCTRRQPGYPGCLLCCILGIPRRKDPSQCQI
jgi:DNA-binding Lrp family transcriptional regulator